MTYVSYVFVSKRSIVGFLSYRPLKMILAVIFVDRFVGAFVNTFKSCRQSVFCFLAKIALLILYTITSAASLSLLKCFALLLLRN